MQKNVIWMLLVGADGRLLLMDEVLAGLPDAYAKLFCNEDMRWTFLTQQVTACCSI
jgi:hypothetical protein